MGIVKLHESTNEEQWNSIPSDFWVRCSIQFKDGQAQLIPLDECECTFIDAEGKFEPYLAFRTLSKGDV